MKEYTVTAEELLKKAMSIMGEESKYKGGYIPFLVDLTNQLMVDCFECNNACREGAGLEPLADMPAVTLMTDVIPYEDVVMTGIMPYGLAFWLLFADDENDRANVCNAEYEQNKLKLCRAMYIDVENAYKG